jgi:hypothetical protein
VMSTLTIIGSPLSTIKALISAALTLGPPPGSRDGT